MKITAIKAQLKNAERVSVYVDGEYKFSLSYSQVLDLKIHAGREVSEPELAVMLKASAFSKAYERALNYVMIRPRSERELLDYARRKQWTQEDTRVILNKLRQKGYLNDTYFAKAWVQSRAQIKNLSRRKLIAELRQKGISTDVINEALNDNNYDDQKALAELVAKKRKLSRYANNEQKLMQYLAGQGFSFDDIKSALSNNH